MATVALDGSADAVATPSAELRMDWQLASTNGVAAASGSGVMTLAGADNLTGSAGLIFSLSGALTIDVPVTPPPEVAEPKVVQRVSVVMPDPVLVDGRPT